MSRAAKRRRNKKRKRQQDDDNGNDAGVLNERNNQEEDHEDQYTRATTSRSSTNHGTFKYLSLTVFTVVVQWRPIEHFGLEEVAVGRSSQQLVVMATAVVFVIGTT